MTKSRRPDESQRSDLRSYRPVESRLSVPFEAECRILYGKLGVLLRWRQGGSIPRVECRKFELNERRSVCRR